jgi:hypothetical protein
MGARVHDEHAREALGRQPAARAVDDGVMRICHLRAVANHKRGGKGQRN